MPAIFAYPNPRHRWLFIGGAKRAGGFVPVLSKAAVYEKYQEGTELALDRLTAMNKVKVVVVTVAARALFQLANTFSLDDLPTSPLYEVALSGLNETVERLIASGKKIVLTIDNPALRAPKQCISRTTGISAVNWVLSLKAVPKCSVPLDLFLDQSRQYRNVLTEIKRRYADMVIIVDTTDLLCDESRRVCEPTMDGRPLYSFSDHVSGFAAAKIANRLVPIAENLADGP